MASSHRPTFLIPGASRSGTTSLCYYLRRHPDIYIPEQKELMFFYENSLYRKGVGFYERQFSEWDGERAIGESSPPYYSHGITSHEDESYRWNPDDDSPKRIQEAYPDIKLILTLRDPISRAYSQFWKSIRQGRATYRSFQKAIEAEMVGERDKTHCGRCWIYRNKHSIHVSRWLDLFPRENIKILIFENWIDEPEATLNEICDFLGVEKRDRWADADEPKNPTLVPRSYLLNDLYHAIFDDMQFWRYYKYMNLREGYPPMEESTKQTLREVFEPDIRRLESLIGVNLNCWLTDL